MIRFWRQLLPAYIFTMPVIFGTYFWALLIHFADSINNNSGHLIRRIIIVTTLHVGVYAALFIFKQIVLDRVRPGLVPSLTLAALALIGISRGFFFENWLFAWDISSTKDVGLRMQTSLVNTVSCFSVGIIGTANSRMYQIKSAQLLNKIDRLQQIKVDALSRIKLIDTKAVADIKTQLETYVIKMQGKSINEILQILQIMIDTVVQPLSRQLEVQSDKWQPSVSQESKIQVNWFKAFKSSLNPEKISYRLIPILMIVSSLPTVIKKTPFLTAFLCLVLSYCVGFFVGKLFRSILANKIVIFGSYLIATTFTGFAMGVSTLPMTQNYNAPIGFLILSTISYPITASLVSMISNADEQLSIATNELAQATEELEWNVARIREAHHQNQRSLARTLHGTVQAKLASAYLDLEKMNLEEEHNPERINQILAEIQDSIATFDVPQPAQNNLSKLIAKTQENWASVAVISFQISEEDLDSVHCDTLSVVALIDVIPELVFNAIKHGKANTIDISIKFTDERVVELTVQDNGKNELINLGSGIGTKILDESSISWNRKRVDGNTTTTAEFAYSLDKTLPN